MSDEEPTIKLDKFLKLASAVGTGGEAKVLIQAGEVLVNGEVETRRGRQLRAGDEVDLQGEIFTVEAG
jgi:ribosome-associated protein